MSDGVSVFSVCTYQTIIISFKYTTFTQQKAVDEKNASERLLYRTISPFC